SRVRVPSAAPYSVTWNAERQVTRKSPLIERAFCRLDFAKAEKTPPIISDDRRRFYWESRNPNVWSP
ncbi:hypothetical protein, partial [Pseudomonas rhodesiae]|uniref:hypothetical protein n=1 Tax=Pseudomonas rhodesiae TaxID=76760 RepID=UPI0032B27F9F